MQKELHHPSNFFKAHPFTILMLKLSIFQGQLHLGLSIIYFSNNDIHMVFVFFLVKYPDNDKEIINPKFNASEILIGYGR